MAEVWLELGNKKKNTHTHNSIFSGFGRNANFSTEVPRNRLRRGLTSTSLLCVHSMYLRPAVVLVCSFQGLHVYVKFAGRWWWGVKRKVASDSTHTHTLRLHHPLSFLASSLLSLRRGRRDKTSRPLFVLFFEALLWVKKERKKKNSTARRLRLLKNFWLEP